VALLADTHGFGHAISEFFASLAAIHWGPLLLGLVCYVGNLTLRSRAAFNVVRAAYPGVPILWRRIWGAYVAAYGANAFIPARPGDVLRLFLVRGSIRGSTYPTVAASFLVENVFDTVIGVLMLAYALTQGVFPKPPDLSKLGAFELSYLAAHPRLTLFILTALAVLLLVGFALLSARVQAFWARLRQWFAILRDRRRYLRQVAALQFAGWGCRFVCFWLLLDAFGIGGSVRNVLLVFGCQAAASLVPLTPGGAGVQQALLVKVLAGEAPGARVAAYSVGQQIAIATVSAGIGLAALVGIFRVRSFREGIRQGRHERTVAAE
jgi:uncharacterized membrane protein YbhN (UPF0104 family)